MNLKKIFHKFKEMFNTADDLLGKRLVNSTIKSVLYGGITYFVIVAGIWLILRINLILFPSGNNFIEVLNTISTIGSIITGLFAIFIQIAHMFIKEGFYLYNTTKTSYLKEGLPGKAGAIAEETATRIDNFKPGDEL